MKIATVRSDNAAGAPGTAAATPGTDAAVQTVAAVQTDDGHYLTLDAPDVGTLLTRVGWREASAAALASGPHEPHDPRTPSTPHRLITADAVQFAPLTPRAGKVICCGLNYAEHIREMGRDLPEYPTLFGKYADTLTGARDDITVSGSDRVDWEAELALVIGHEISRADEATAQAAIAGYTIANDVSLRDWQNRTLQWLQGKAHDATTPLGPHLVTADEFAPDHGFDVSCAVNGERVQHANTATLVFGPARLVAYISQFTTLRPGDVVLTGTPGGVGMGMHPPRYLADGDLLETHIEGLGTLTNRIRLA